MGRQLVGRVTYGVRTGAMPGPAGALLKLYSATTSVRTTTIAADIAGAAATAWAPATEEGAPDGGRLGRAYLMRQGICLAGGLIHLLLVIALIVAVINLVTGRRTV